MIPLSNYGYSEGEQWGRFCVPCSHATSMVPSRNGHGHCRWGQGDDDEISYDRNNDSNIWRLSDVYMIVYVYISIYIYMYVWLCMYINHVSRVMMIVIIWGLQYVSLYIIYVNQFSSRWQALFGGVPPS